MASSFPVRILILSREVGYEFGEMSPKIIFLGNFVNKNLY